MDFKRPSTALLDGCEAKGVVWVCTEALLDGCDSQRRGLGLHCKKEKRQTTPRGFEPLRAEPNGFLVHLLSHSDTVSSGEGAKSCFFMA